MPNVVRTVLAGDLSSAHRGLTVSGQTYRNANKTQQPSPGVRVFEIDTIHHLKNGAILLNGSHPYLRPDTVLTVLDPVLQQPELVHDGEWTTEEELDALPMSAVIVNPEGNPHAYQKRWCTIGGQKLARWFCTTDADWPESSARLLSENTSFITVWLPKGAS